MRRSHTLATAVALAVGAVAWTAPATVQAQFGTGGGTCPNSTQTFGSGAGARHAFDQSHNNCVDFVGTDDFAFLHGSDSNLVQIFGVHNGIDDFVKSNNNVVSFDPGNGGGSTLNTSGADFNAVEFFSTSANDILTMVGTQDVGIGIAGTNDFLATDSSCAPGTLIIYTQSGQGSASKPIVLC